MWAPPICPLGFLPSPSLVSRRNPCTQSTKPRATILRKSSQRDTCHGANGRGRKKKRRGGWCMKKARSPAQAGCLCPIKKTKSQAPFERQDEAIATITGPLSPGNAFRRVCVESWQRTLTDQFKSKARPIRPPRAQILLLRRCPILFFDHVTRRFSLVDSVHSRQHSCTTT